MTSRNLFKFFTLLYAIFLLPPGWAMAGNTQIQKDKIDIPSLTSTPTGWKQKGMWGFDKQLIMSPQKGLITHLQRDLMGDGHIIAGFRITKGNSAIPGITFRFPNGRISIERRIINDNIFAVMVLEQNGKVMGEKVLSIPDGDLEFMLQRKGDNFSSWVAEPKKDFRQVAALDWPNISNTMQIAVFGRVTEGISFPVNIIYLEAVGAAPEVATISRDNFNNGYLTKQSPLEKEKAGRAAREPGQPSPPSGAQNAGKIDSINMEWGYVVLQFNRPGSITKGDLLFVVRQDGSVMDLEIKKTSGTSASAIPQGDIGMLHPGMTVFRK